MNTPARILVADDNETNRDILATRLEANGYEEQTSDFRLATSSREKRRIGRTTCPSGSQTRFAAALLRPRFALRS
jgi:CheY-like chemotaxis protein